MSRFTSTLCATLLVTSIAACDKDVLSSPEISSPIGISKSTTVCTSGCTSNYNALGQGGDTVWMAIGTDAIVAPLSGVSNMIVISVTPLDPHTGVSAIRVDDSHIEISTSAHACEEFYLRGPKSCGQAVTYVAGSPPSNADNESMPIGPRPASKGGYYATETKTIVVVLLPPPTIQNVTIPVGYTSWAPMLVPASQFATDVEGTPLTVTAATAQTSVAGLTVSVVNGQLAVTRIFSFFSSAGSVPVSVTVSDGKTSATGVITLNLQ